MTEEETYDINNDNRYPGCQPSSRKIL